MAIDDWYLYRKGKAFTDFMKSINHGFQKDAKSELNFFQVLQR